MRVLLELLLEVTEHQRSAPLRLSTCQGCASIVQYCSSGSPGLLTTIRNPLCLLQVNIALVPSGSKFTGPVKYFGAFLFKQFNLARRLYMYIALALFRQRFVKLDHLERLPIWRQVLDCYGKIFFAPQLGYWHSLSFLLFFLNLTSIFFSDCRML